MDRKESLKKWREENKEKVREYNRKHHKKHYLANRDKVMEKNIEWQKHNREKYNETHKILARKYVKKYPTKIKARAIAQKIRVGDKCIFCCGTKNLEKHHPDYLKPKKIMTLCRHCHNIIHRNYKEVNNG